MKSPLVIAMPQPMADAAKRSTPTFGWKDLIDAARDPMGWAHYGRADLGQFRLGNTRPTTSTSGLHGLIAVYRAAAGNPGPPTADDIGSADVRRAVCDTYSRVAHETDSAGDYLRMLFSIDQNFGAAAAMAHTSAIAVEEKQVFEYNRGNPGSDYPPPAPKNPNGKLVAVYAYEGTLVADHPFVILNWRWVGSLEKAAASDFLSYLERDDIQKKFRDAGFRDALGQADPGVLQAPYFDSAAPGLELHPPASEVLAEMQRSWSELRSCAANTTP